MAASKWSHRSLSLASIGVFLAIVVFANLISQKAYTTRDLTAQKVFTLSDMTRKMMENLNDKVNVTFYVTKDLPPELRAPAQFVEEMVRDLSQYSKGKLTFRRETPPEDEEKRKDLAKLSGIEPQLLQVSRKGKSEQALIYCHMLIQYRDKSQVLLMPQQNTFESEFARAITKLTQEKKPIIKFFSNDPKFQFDRLVGALGQMGMLDLFDVRSDWFEKGEARALNIPKDTALLVLAKPQDLKDWQLYSIDQYLMDGGKVLVLAEGSDIMEPLSRFDMEDSRYNLYKMIDHYGIGVQTKLVQDFGSFIPLPVRKQRGMITFVSQVPYPLWPRLDKANIKVDNAAFRQVVQVAFPFASDITWTKAPDGVTTETLIVSSPKSALMDYPYDLQPSKDGKITVPEKTGEHVLGARATGKFTSYFADKKDKPVPPPSDRNNAASMLWEKDTGSRPPRDAAEKAGELIVLSSARAFDVQTLQQLAEIAGPVAQQNISLFQNLLEFMTVSADLIAIRSKDIQIPFLKEGITDDERLRARLFSTVAVPAALMLLGFVYYYFRKIQLRRTGEVFGA